MLRFPARSTPFVKEMTVGGHHSNLLWKDIMADDVNAARVTLSSQGRGIFTCPPNGVALWVPE